jgi:hypothetical protein
MELEGANTWFHSSIREKFEDGFSGEDRRSLEVMFLQSV